MIKMRINGQLVDVPVIKGTDGKTAYQYAVEAGYQGTEQEFTNDLVNNSNTISTHLTDESAHSDIRESINELSEKVDNIEITGGGGNASIDDTTVSTDTTWSSEKIEGLSKAITLLNYEALSEEAKLNGTAYYITDEGCIIYKGITYGKKSVVHCTEEFYLSLPDTKISDGIIYMIEDKDIYIGDTIPYNNSNSGLVATNISDAIDEVNTKSTNALNTAEEANSIAKGRNQSHVFNTTEDMQTWLSNQDNKGKCSVGSNLYIKDIGVPDWWVSEVLEEADTETGYYYNIAQLETQKVDLTEIDEEIDTKVDKVDGKGLSTEDYTTEEKNKLSSIAEGAEVNQNAISNITVGDTTIEATTKTDGLNLVAGTDIELIPDVDNKSVTISNNNGVSNTVSGNNPIITNSTDGNPIYLKNNGYTKQKTMTGKNLAKSFTVGKYMQPNENGVLWVYANACYTEDYIAVKNGQYYTVNCDITNWNCNVVCYDTNKSFVKDISSKKTFLIDDENIKYIRVCIWDSTSSTSFTGTYLQVEEGTVATDYEPYCGGIASPNPNYPQEIKGLGDKGYFDGDLVQGYIGSSGTIITDSHAVTSKNIIPCSEEDTIVINYEETVTNLAIATYNNGTYVRTIDGANVSSNSYTIPSGVDGFKFFIYDGNGITPSTAKHISVTINGQYAIRVKTCGKNLLNARLNVTIGSNDSYYVPVKPNTTYTLTLKQKCVNYVEGKSSAQHWYALKNSDGKSTKSSSMCGMVFSALNEILTRTQIITTDTDTVQLLLDLGSYFNSPLQMQTIEAQLEEGKVSTPFVKHQETTALIPVSTPFYDGDYIEVYADGSGQIVRENGEYDVTSWSYFANILTNSKEARRYFSSNVDITRPFMCTIAKHVNSTWNLDTLCICSYGGSSDTLEISVRVPLDAELTDYPCKIVYKLKEPTTEPLTAEQVAEFKKLQTFKGVTHINADGEVTVRYYCNTDNGETVSMLQDQIDKNNNLARYNGEQPMTLLLENVDESTTKSATIPKNTWIQINLQGGGKSSGVMARINNITVFSIQQSDSNFYNSYYCLAGDVVSIETIGSTKGYVYIQ